VWGQATPQNNIPHALQFNAPKNVRRKNKKENHIETTTTTTKNTDEGRREKRMSLCVCL